MFNICNLLHFKSNLPNTGPSQRNPPINLRVTSQQKKLAVLQVFVQLKQHYTFLLFLLRDVFVINIWWSAPMWWIGKYTSLALLCHSIAYTGLSEAAASTYEVISAPESPRKPVSAWPDVEKMDFSLMVCHVVEHRRTIELLKLTHRWFPVPCYCR